MQKSQESKIKMARAVAGILSGNEPTVNSTPGLSTANQELQMLIGETESHSQGQMNRGTELTAQKKRGAFSA